MNPRQFLIIGGVILLILGIFGFLFPNPVGNRTVLHFDAWENWAHTLLGIVAIVVGYFLPQVWQRWITFVVGIVALFFAIVGFAVIRNPFPNFLGAANLENPIDNIIHLVVGVWAFYAFFAAVETREARERREERRAA